LYLTGFVVFVHLVIDYISTQEPRTYLTAFVSMFILSLLKKHVHFSTRYHNVLSFLIVSYLVVLGLSLPITIKLSSMIYFQYYAIYIVNTTQLVAAKHLICWDTDLNIGFSISLHLRCVILTIRLLTQKITLKSTCQNYGIWYSTMVSRIVAITLYL